MDLCEEPRSTASAVVALREHTLDRTFDPQLAAFELAGRHEIPRVSVPQMVCLEADRGTIVNSEKIRKSIRKMAVRGERV